MNDQALHGQLLHGHVMHERVRPQRNRFTYPVFYLRLDLDRLQDCNSFWFGVDRRRLLSLRTRDYGPRDGSSLADWMRALLREHGIAADGRIWLQTFPASPVSRLIRSASGTATTRRANCARYWRRSTTPSAPATATCCA